MAQITEKEGFSPPNSKGGTTLFLAGVVTLTELTGSAVATYEANEAIALVKFVASVKIYLAVKSIYRYFLTTNQLFCFRFDTER